MAELNITNIPAPRVPFVDERTGLMAREWYRFFLNLFVLTGSGNNPVSLEELQLGPPNQPDLAELLIQVNQNIAPQYEDQSGDFLATLDTAQLMSMMSRFENLEAAIQGAYLNPPQTPTTGGEVSGPSSSTDNAIARFDGTSGELIQNSVTTIDDTGNASGILSQQFSDGTAVTLAAGKMWYDGTTGAWNAGMGNGNITQQIGEEIFVYGKASAAITDSPLQIIYHTGVVGASGVIKFAPTIAGITDVNAIIGVATESLALNGFGRATVFGVVRNITTNGTAFGEVWADDDVIWYNPVTGNPTKVEPVAPYIKVQVGLVIKAGAGGSGSFQVNIARGSKLGGTDSNVQFGALANNNLIAYDSAAGYWKNVTASSIGLGTVSSVAQSFTGGLISVAGSPITTSGTLALTVAGTSGGVPYFSSASTWATSAALAASALVVGGGAGAAPATTTTGTGVVTALGVNTGTAGAFVVNGGALGSPSSAGTIPAFTLGGTVAGGGNQLNNVIIGTTTPLAGAFTTLSATGNITRTIATTAGYAFITNAGVNTGAYTVYVDGTSTRIGNEVALPIDIQSNATTIGRFSSTGLAVTGTLTSTGNGLISNGVGAITNPVGWTNLFQIRSNNSPAFSLVDTNAGGTSVQQWDIASNAVTFNLYNATLGSAALTVNATTNLISITSGLEVTGAITATTTGKVGTTLGVGGTTPSASGAGITFPATQSASTDVNTLDDYEEGTWTPAQGSGLTVVGAFSSSGRYTKIGRAVNISGRLAGATSIATTAGTVMMTGLPFTVAELSAVGSMTNGSLNTFGGVAAFATTAYSTTTIAATVAIDFSITYSV